MPAESRKRWSAAEARELNARNPSWWPRYEVIDGELLVTPAPRPVHQYAVQALLVRLAPYTKTHRVGHTLMAPADIELEPDTTVGPDVFVIPWAVGVKPARWSEMTALVLAVEVLSPSTARSDRVKKRHYYSRNDVPEYWIVDCDARVIERRNPRDDRAVVIEDRLVWAPQGAAEPFVLDVPGYFADVFDEDRAS